MSNRLECEEFEGRLDLAVSGCRSWVDLQLAPDVQNHLACCQTCTTRTQQLLEIERRLWELQEEDLPDWDLSASVMARLTVYPPQKVAAQPQPTRLVWAPLLLLLGLWIPEPGGIPDWVALVGEWFMTCWTFVAVEFALDWRWSWPSSLLTPTLSPRLGDGVLWLILGLAAWSAWSLAPRKGSLT